MKIIHLLLLAPLLLLSCGERRQSVVKANRADSVMFATGRAQDYPRMLELADSFEATGDISEVNANRWRGVGYYYQQQYRAAEYYYDKVVKADIRTGQDRLNYYKSARRLAAMLVKKGDYEGALHIALPAVAMLKEHGDGSNNDFAILHGTIGYCQLKLGRTKEANASYQNSCHYYDKAIAATDSARREIEEACIGAKDAAVAYIDANLYEEAMPWIDRTEQLLNSYATFPGALPATLDEFNGRIALHRAIAFQGMGNSAEAAKEYRKMQATDYRETGEGIVYANRYLMAAGRYREAADNFSNLDRLLDRWNVTLTLDNIQTYLLSKYRAIVGAQRKDSAIAVGTWLCDALDKAIVESKKSDAAELATVYDTQQKEAQIARQQADLSSQRLIGTGIALLLALVFFVVYTLHKREATHRLAAAHAKLQQAYDQLEETTAAKERIESELRIARDIQMSMVPGIFPEREGLDLYASMTPAKEVGGDLYGYFMEGDHLYFCIGDVSGKGVPASLFMAQATRLFRTLSAQKMMPAEIATRMNDALVEGNDQGMFVTMFIGLADLKTGRLDFCNAGHNPPVLRKATGESSFIDMLANAPIGLWPGLEYDGEVIDCIKGCPMLFYTDGLNEAENLEQEQLGDDRLLEILHAQNYGSAKEVVDHLIAEVQSHRNGAEPNDDLTILCLFLN